MKIYFDESGNTGCIIPNKNGALYNDEQRHFVLAGIICRDKEDEQVLAKRYLDFKNRYHIQGEIKGSDMMKRDNNTMLFDFIDNLIDDSHFYVCCYDKIFYLASIITQYFFPRQMMEEDPLFYFTQVSALTQEDISIFFRYCECNAIGTEQAYPANVAPVGFRGACRGCPPVASESLRGTAHDAGGRLEAVAPHGG